MPELPEVEVVRRSLNKIIKQKKVKNVIIRNKNLRFKIPFNFTSFLKNKKILKVGRFSKYIIFNLSNNSYCLLHLGMSGTLHVIKSNKKNSVTNTSFYSSPYLPEKHNHVEIVFTNFRIVYNDPRRFGFFQIIKNYSLLKKKFFHLGPEPFQKEFNLNYVKSFLNEKNKNIKNFLLDQSFVSGIGNIYASEILFSSKINPQKKAHLLNEKDYKKIIYYSKKILLKAIKKGGSSIKNFKNTSGRKGKFQNTFNVYAREGSNCKRLKCYGTIRKKIMNNRSTFLCNICQN